MEGVEELGVWFGRQSVQGRAITSQGRDPKREHVGTSKESGVAGRGARRGRGHEAGERGSTEGSASRAEDSGLSFELLQGGAPNSGVF